MTTGTPSRISDWQLERLAAGDLPAQRAAELRTRLAASEDGEARLRALEASNRDILARLPAPAMAEAIGARLGAPGRSRRRLPYLLMPAAAAAVLALVVFAGGLLPGGNVVTEPSPGGRVVTESSPGGKGVIESSPGGKGVIESSPGGLEPTRIKGEPHLVVARQREPGPERLQPGDAVHPGDVLQVAYLAGGSRYGVVVSVDGHGVVTRHLPELGELASGLDADRAVELPHAFELDDAPGFERFFFVTAPRPFAVALVVAAAEELGRRPGEAVAQALRLPAELAQSSFLLRKADR